MRVRASVVAGLLALGGVALVAAQERGAAPRAGRPGLATIQQELGLSAEQSAQLEKLWADGRKQAIRQRADLAIARMELEEAMNATTVDEKAVAAKVKAVSDLQATALRARTEQRLAIRRLLTPEQQQKMKQLMGRHRMERGPRPAREWGRRQGRRPATTPPPGPGGPSDEGDEAPSPEPGR
jgi:Spy/CpxP family protein refolding chaperone